jgi:hypothetical protein
MTQPRSLRNRACQDMAWLSETRYTRSWSLGTRPTPREPRCARSPRLRSDSGRTEDRFTHLQRNDPNNEPSTKSGQVQTHGTANFAAPAPTHGIATIAAPIPQPRHRHHRRSRSPDLRSLLSPHAGRPARVPCAGGSAPTPGTRRYPPTALPGPCSNFLNRNDLGT